MKNKIDIGQKLIVHWDPRAPATECYRHICTNIKFSYPQKEIKTILVTSPGPGEGKSLTSANLAIAMAQNKKRTLFVDADLRKPCGHHIFGLPNAKGLSFFLSGAVEIGEIIQSLDIPGLFIVTAGLVPPSPSELLGSDRMDFFIKETRSDFDMLVIDSPPMIVTDPVILSVKADGCVLVIDAKKTKAAPAIKAVKQLRKVNADILGVVLNRQKVELNEYYY